MGEFDNDKTDVSVRLPTEFLNDELLPLYPAATSLSEAIRMALQDHVDRKDQLVQSGEVHNDVIEALENAGGRIENIQRIEIAAGDDLEFDSKSSVSVEADE